MKSRTGTIVGAGVAAAVVAVAGVAWAAAGPLASRRAADSPLGRLIQANIGRAVTLRAELNVTEEQRQQIAEVLRAHQSEIRAVVEKTVANKRAMREAVLSEINSLDPRVKAIVFRRNFGKSAALAVGFAEASGDVIVTMDADLQDDPREIPNLIGKLDEGYDLVVGWRLPRRERHAL